MRTHLFRALFIVAISFTLASSAFAQAGLVRGTVLDSQGAPVDGANLEFIGPDGVSKKTTTDKKGAFVMIGLKSGAWKVTAKKDKLEETLMANVRQGGGSNLEFRIAPARASAADNKKFVALQALFAEGNAAVDAGDHDGAIAKFTEALVLMPDCKDCYVNIGFEYNTMRDYPKAIEAFQKALEIDNQHADAATFLGVAYFNTAKFAEAKASFEIAAQVNPMSGFVQYHLGMAAINLNQLPDAVKALEAYLKADPEGDKAAEVTATLPALKGMIK
jgi:tetratricopeptide (TPR) repeat protein